MEEVKEEVKEKPRGILLKKEAIRKANTYGPSGGGGFADKKKRKRVGFVDRTKTGNLCTYFNYEQVEVQEDEEKSPRNSSCACVVI